MGKRLINNSVYFIFILLSFQCKKDRDAVPPQVTITAPSENQLFNVYDTFTLKAEISDDKGLSIITIKLLNDQMSAMQQPVVLSVKGKQVALNRLYTLYDVHLPTGMYYICVEASDGTNTTPAFLKLFIKEAPLYRKSIYAVTRNASTLNVVKIDSSLTASNKMSFTSDYSGSGISSYYQNLFVCGNYTGSFKSIDLATRTIKWSENVVISTFPYFTSMSAWSKPYVSYYSGDIKSYDNVGLQQFHAVLASTNFYPIKAVENGDYVLVEAKDKSGPTKKLVTFYLATDFGVQETYITGDVVAYAYKSANEVYLFSNEAGQGKMEIYSIIYNNFFTPHILPAGKIWSAVQIDADDYLIACDDENIYHYQYSINSLTMLISGVKAYQ
ncbi:MAG: hypothetical protein IT235_08060, partial [Bacteroidia bacterium]|nr:hypothetical protein [Bacteroidia bacterium]